MASPNGSGAATASTVGPRKDSRPGQPLVSVTETSVRIQGSPPSPARLRPYQTDVIAEYDRMVAAGRRKIILVAPTGAGKTEVSSAIIKNARAARKSIIVLAHRREIITHTSRKLHAHGIPHGIIQAGFPGRPFEDVQVASVSTLFHRAVRTEAMQMPPADLLIIDECHHAPARTYRKIIGAFPAAVLLGLTATPCRGDGRGLGGIFEVMIQCPQVGKLIEQGYLVKTRIYAPCDPDLNGIQVKAGDYAETQLAERMNRPKLIGDIVTHWHKYSERRKTVVFAVSVGHSIHICDEFIKSGVRAEHIDGSTPKTDRDATLTRLAAGTIDVVSNCAVLTEGWDMPEVGCCILARPTRQMGLYRQMVGRVLRPAPGKTDAIVLDHSGAVFKHGFPEDPVCWTLSPDQYSESPKHARRLEAGWSSRLLECTRCETIRIASQPCSHCGFMPRPPARAVAVAAGELGRVENGVAQRPAYDPVARANWHGMLTAIQIQRGYKPGWANINYREKFGVWPPVRGVPPIAPTPEVLSWVRSRMIAFAKARGAAQ
jgi:DNA repair protein RadD